MVEVQLSAAALSSRRRSQEAGVANGARQLPLGGDGRESVCAANPALPSARTTT